MFTSFLQSDEIFVHSSLIIHYSFFRAHSPDGIARIVGYEQASIGKHKGAHRTSVCLVLALVGHEAREKIFGRTRGLAIGKRHEGHFVAGKFRAVPRAVLTNEGAAMVSFRKSILCVKSKAETSSVRAHCHVG